MLERIKAWAYADGLSSLLHAIAVLAPSAALLNGWGALFVSVAAVLAGLRLMGVTSEFIPSYVIIGAGAVLGMAAMAFPAPAAIVWAVGMWLFYLRREKADITNAKTDTKVKDGWRDLAFPTLALVMAVGMALDKILAG